MPSKNNLTFQQFTQGSKSPKVRYYNQETRSIAAENTRSVKYFDCLISFFTPNPPLGQKRKFESENKVKMRITNSPDNETTVIYVRDANDQGPLRKISFNIVNPDATDRDSVEISFKTKSLEKIRENPLSPNDEMEEKAHCFFEQHQVVSVSG